MTKRRKDTDYLFLSARIRAMERRLLTAQRLEQLLTAPSVEACAQLLSEWGYAPVHDEPSLQAALSAQREAVFADVSRFMPEAEVLDVFRLKYDYHNIKTLLKAPQDAERLLIDAGTVPAETMQKKHAENGGWDFLPADMAAAADEAQRVLAETGSARSSDCILDRAYFARLEKLAADRYPLHMPGHKRRGSDIGAELDPYAIDITEIDNFDNLHHAEGIIKEAQAEAAALYGAKRAYFLINGSTCGILAAISAATKRGDKVLVARNCHKAVYHALYLRQLHPVFTYPEITRTGLQGQITEAQIRAAFDENPDIKAVVITSPTYDGVVSDVAAIASVAHAHGALLVVDEAHGAHFGFGGGFPQNAIALGPMRS